MILDTLQRSRFSIFRISFIVFLMLHFENSISIINPTLIRTKSYYCYAFTTTVHHPTWSRRSSIRAVSTFKAPTTLLDASIPSSINENIHPYKTIEESTTVTHVPTNMKEALYTFFLSNTYHGPRLVVLLLFGLIYQRIQLGIISSISHYTFFPLINDDICISIIAIIFWWFQEHYMHQHLLHSQYNWFGKDIHIQHHNKPYHHISIDPAPLMISWFSIVFFILYYISPLPLHLVYSATIAYGIAGLLYEWTHYIVHTKVRFKSNSFWQHIKNHHARHHLINHNYWFAFSMIHIDTIFGTNPNVSNVPRIKNNFDSTT